MEAGLKAPSPSEADGVNRTALAGWTTLSRAILKIAIRWISPDTGPLRV
jgi:hypothetical protein